MIICLLKKCEIFNFAENTTPFISDKRNGHALKCLEGNVEFALDCTKMKFSIKDFFSKCDQSAGSCRFGHSYGKNP